jgi:hypothetical protein
MAKLVRLKRRDPKRGHVLRRYTAFGVRFEEKKGWYRVSDEVAAYLAQVHQLDGDDDSPLAFDVCTPEEAEALEAAEKKKADERARATEPHVTDAVDAPAHATAAADLTTADLTTADLAPARTSREPRGRRG